MAEEVNPQVIDEKTTNGVNTLGSFPISASNAMLAQMQASQARRDNDADANARIVHGLVSSAFGEAIGPRAGPDVNEAAATATTQAISSAVATGVEVAITKLAATMFPQSKES